LGPLLLIAVFAFMRMASSLDGTFTAEMRNGMTVHWRS
jgi:hypothetical protein